jgi:hypothetical protein
MREPCGAPTTGVQVPSLPLTLQASHWPLQGESQHTPSTHRPLAQSSALPHATPFFFRQTPGVVEASFAHELPSPQLETVQHTPSVQLPLAHSAEAPQLLPSPSTRTQLPALQ